MHKQYKVINLCINVYYCIVIIGNSYCVVNHPLPSQFLLFWVLGVCPLTIKVFLLLTLFTWGKTPGSPCLHNCNVHIPQVHWKFFCIYTLYERRILLHTRQLYTGNIITMYINKHNYIIKILMWDLLCMYVCILLKWKVQLLYLSSSPVYSSMPNALLVTQCTPHHRRRKVWRPCCAAWSWRKLSRVISPCIVQ